MRGFFAKKNLFVRIAVGFVIGIIVGLLWPQLAIETKVLGDLYLNLIKMLIVPVIFVSVASGISNIKSTSMLRNVGFKTVVTYVLMFVFAMIVSLVVAYWIRPGLNISFDTPPVFDQELVTPSLAAFLLSIVPSNPIEAMASTNVVGVITFTIFFAVAMVSIKEKAEPVKVFLNSLSQILFKILDYVMEVSPIGVMSLMAYALAQYGMGIFGALGKYIMSAYLASFVCLIIVIYVPLYMYTRLKVKPFLRGMYKI